MIATVITPKGETYTGLIHEWFGPGMCSVIPENAYSSQVGILEETYKRRMASVSYNVNDDWALSDNWKARCVSCTYARNFGNARIAALTAADKHGRKYPLHAVQVIRNEEVLEFRIPERTMDKLPGLETMDRKKIRIIREAPKGITVDFPSF